MSVRQESGTRTGWLYNYHPTTEMSSEGGDEEGVDGAGTNKAALVLLLQDHAGDMFYVHLHYHPYFFVLVAEGHEREVEMGILSMFGPQLIFLVQSVEKEDLDLLNHLSGRKRHYLKVSFHNVQDLTAVRSRIDSMVKRNTSLTSDNPLWSQFNTSLGQTMAKTFEDDPLYNPSGSSRWMDWVMDIREYDVKYHMRVAIDLKVFCGLWYDVTVTEGVATVVRCDDTKYAPAMPRVVAFDIETTKAPLKFPQPEVDQIYMISYMLDGRGYLITNREIVTEDISPFEYTPKKEYEGQFATFNEVDEAATLRRFFDEMKTYKPNVYVTYNGDYFDFPFIHARALFHGMNMRNEIGFTQNSDGAFLHSEIPHLDCFYWVKRDSYLPQGSQGLKAVTKYKLGYDPIEVDPEDMLPLAQSHPQRMASYSVSDAVSTWYLYHKYVHPFIFSLATIIPMSPDDVLRKGSGGLCESLLMVQAEANNVIFPNKKEMVRERFHDGHLIDTETYIGGRVEALRSGVYRSDIPLAFNMNPETYQSLMDDVDDAMRFTLEVENNTKVADVTNYEEVKASIVAQLMNLRDHPRQQEKPLIYHLDVGAMYPNIILTNRLQPYAIAAPDVCAGCCFNSPNNEHQCKRAMSWKWRGEMFTAGRYEFQRVKAQLENESFAASVIEQANLAAVQKKAYGNRKGNVLEGTAYERKPQGEWKRQKNGGGGGSGGGGGNGYRQENKRQQLEAAEALLSNFKKDKESDGSGSDEDENGPKAYHKLNENTQFNMLKKRLGEYSRKAYGKVHESKEIMRSNVVCQRENAFYVDTVRLFRDRRYEYKAALKTWKKKLDAATDPDDVKLCQSRCVQMESLQLAHKCILNSFYGYVMRKGSRWYSMEMAGIVTYLGATLIQMARALVQQIGVTLELDTDGIWCCLPCTFPETFTFTTNNPSKPKISISYPCVVLNKMVNDRYSNHQYHDLISPGVYSMRSECSIYFEVDGPYLAMLLPASREEGKSIKKRYAVFHPDGRLAELKGFELKRRGELMLIKDFQSQVFRRFLDGTSLVESYASAGDIANTALDMLESKGEGYDMEEILDKITESSNMTRRLSEYPESQKSLAITTARRIAEFLGPQMVKEKGLSCRFIISRLPAGRPVTERAIPLMIFRAEDAIRTHFLRKWTGDAAFPAEVDLKVLLDWDYYTMRFNACVQKIITIPAALQSIPNPVPRVVHPDWLQKRIIQQNSRFRQVSLVGMLTTKQQQNEERLKTAAAEVVELQDLEDIVADSKPKQQRKQRRANGDASTIDVDSDWTDGDAASVKSDEDEEAQKKREMEEEAENLAREVQLKYFGAKSKQIIDADFFAHRGTKTWLQNMKQSWLHRAKLRGELQASQVSPGADGETVAGRGAVGAHFIDLKSKALAETWSVLEVRPSPDDPGTVTAIVALSASLYTFRIVVPKTVIVDVDGAHAAVIGRLAGVVEVQNRILPRGQPAQRLFEVPLPSGPEGEQLLNELRISEGVRNIYEAHISREDRCVESMGCCAQVQTSIHLANARQRPANQRDAFALNEFELSPSHNYLNKVVERSAFIFHLAADTRAVIGVANLETNTALFVVVQPAAAARPNLNWKSLAEDAARQFEAGQVMHPTVRLETAVDQTTAWRMVRQVLSEAGAGKLPLLAVMESAHSTADLLQLHAIPAELPYLRVLGAAEDEKLFTDPFRWSRLIARRFLQRLYASRLWIEERVALSRLSGIPVCNIAHDSCGHVMDVLYARALHRRGHVLWCSADSAITFDTVEERPREVVMPGGYTNWCVEFSLSRLDVVAILFSQLIQEGDDPNAHVLCDRGVSTHFNILRDLIADLLGQAVQNSVADSLLSNVARWLRDPVSACYEPRLVETLSGLAHRALTTVLLRLAKLGGRPVKVDSRSVVVLTNKYALQDAVSFARFVTSSLEGQPMLVLLALQPVRFWGSYVVIDRRDYAGLYIGTEEAIQFLENEEPRVEDMRMEHLFSLFSRLPEKVRQLGVARVLSTLQRLQQRTLDVQREIRRDTTIMLATRSEQTKQKILATTQALFEKILQDELLDEVQRISDDREVYSKEERDAAPDSSALSSSGVVALEYTKAITRVLEAIPCSGAVSKIKNNALRLCGVSPFSPSAQVTNDPLITYRTIDVVCSFCNVSIYIDLGTPRRSSVGWFSCPSCRSPISAKAVEATLVRHVTQLVRRTSQQDFVCAKCSEMTASYMMDNCCGPLVGKEPRHDVELQTLKLFARLQGFQWLEECIDTTLMCL